MAVLAGLLAMTGIEHGIGEIRQGPVAPRSLVIESWPDSPAFEVLAGEPALTVVPNLAYSGILAVLMSLLAAAWAAVAAHRRHGGLVLVGLCGVLLVVGGGFGPPLLGTVLGLTLTLAQRRAPRSTPGAGLARWWPWPLVVATASFLGLFPGTVLLQQLTDLDAAWAVPALTLMGFTGAVVAVLAARARDHQRSAQPPDTPRPRPDQQELTMLSHDQPATTPAVRRRPAGRVRIVLLTADIGYALLYRLGHDLVAALLRPDYSPIGLAASGPSWLPFPMSARGDIAGSGGGLTDVMHVVLLHGARRRSDVDGPGR